ncbi:syntaxin-8 [Nematostella vectensis]|uniref:syntaxin-8 n=1 Tax=Nematostella vectensis TaxID=45351 RepID=UPI0020778DC1|nr:syntaxin-8 [Nematostella vectensis]
MALDSWLTQFKTVEQYGQEVMEKINVRNQQRRAGGNFSKAQTDARLMLKNFTRDVGSLKQSLLRASSSYHITEREVQRRQNMLDQLVTKEKQLSSAFNQETTSNDFGRDTLLAGSSRGPNPFSSPAIETDDMSVGDMRNQQQQIISEQDRGLEALSSIIQRQKMIGYAIGDEVDSQNEIIDEVTDQTTLTNARIVKATTHAQKVSAKSSTCGMLVVIVLLLITIVIVGVVPK